MTTSIPSLSDYYNKTESDGKYALKDASYTKTKSDSMYVKTSGDTTINGSLTVSGNANFGNGGRCRIYSFENQNGYTIHDIPTDATLRCENGGFNFNKNVFMSGTITDYR